MKLKAKELLKKTCMKPTKHKAAEKGRVLKAVRKRPKVKTKKKDEARSEEATEGRSQQECILSGGVYLHHRLKDNLLPFLPPKYTTTTRGTQLAAFGRAGVQETVYG